MKHIATTAIALVLLATVSEAAFSASSVGVTSAVNPDAFGFEPGKASRKLILGKKVIFKERIKTASKGLVQILLLDGSSFTVGPNSDLVIDEFVYDPKSNTGKLTASLAKGAFRFIGGKLSKKAGAVKVKTPLALIGIRGAITNVSFDPISNQASCSLVFGNNCNVNGNTVYQPGYTAVANRSSGGSVNIAPTTSQQINTFQNLLSGPLGSTGGAFVQPTDQTVEESSVDEGNSDKSPKQNSKQGTPSTVQSTDANDVDDSLADNEQFIVPEVTRTRQRILFSGSTFTTGSGTVLNGAGIPSFAQSIEFSGNSTQTSAQTSAGIVSFAPVSNSTNDSISIPTTASTPFGTATGNVFIGVDDALVFHQLFANGDTDVPFYLIRGTETPTANLVGNGDLRTYKLLQDPRQQTIIPFADAQFGGAVPSGTSSDGISDFLVLEPTGTDLTDDGNPATTGTPVVLQASVSFDGDGILQKSVGFLVTGSTRSLVEREDDFIIVGGIPKLGRRGSLRRIASESSFASGSSAQQLVEGTDGQYFYGDNAEYFIIGSDLFNNEEVNELIPGGTLGLTADDLNEPVFHIAELDTEAPISGTRTLTTINGYASGSVEPLLPIPASATSLPFTVRNEDPANVQFDFDATLNTLSAVIGVSDNADGTGTDPNVVSYNFSFGFDATPADSGQSAYIDDDRFGASEKRIATGTTILAEDDPVTPTTLSVTPSDGEHKSYVVASGVVNNVLPGGAVACTTCSFLKWGYWGSNINAPAVPVTEGGPRNDRVHLGTWVAGNLPTQDQLPLTGNATYNGHAIASVSRSDGATLSQYHASGDLAVNWDFGSRAGTLAITNFDDVGTISGAISDPSVIGTATNTFTGALTDGAGLTGNTTGSFAGGPTIPFAQGVIGNFSVSGTVGSDDYRATGVYAGSTPVINP